MSMGKRIRELRKAKGLTLEEVGQAFGISRGAVSEWENDKTRPDPKRMPGLAKLLGTTTDDLHQGGKTQRLQRMGNIEELKRPAERVPLLTWEQVAVRNTAMDKVGEPESTSWLLCVAPHSSSAYAVRVRGDSMYAPYGKSYPDGCIIFVDPEMLEPTPGQRIIARVDATKEVTFKVYEREAGRAWLKPLNPQHPPILEGFTILGTVIGKWEDE